MRLLLEGELDPLRKVLDQLPEDLVRSDPEIAIALAGAHVDAGDDAKATRWFRVAREGRDAVAADRRPAFDVGMATVGLLRGRLRGDSTRRSDTRGRCSSPPTRTGWSTTACGRSRVCQLGIAEVWIGNNDRARDELETARAAATAAGRDWLLVQAVAHLALQAMVDGRYERASMLAADAAKLAERRGWCQTWPVGLCELTLSGIAFHQEHLDDAGRHCDPRLGAAPPLRRPATARPARDAARPDRRRPRAARSRPGGDPRGPGVAARLADRPRDPGAHRRHRGDGDGGARRAGGGDRAARARTREPRGRRRAREPRPARRRAGARPHGRRAAPGLRRTDGSAHGRRGLGDRGAGRRRPRRSPGRPPPRSSARSTTPSPRACGGRS